nr:reverse transcriptase domain-containing protein [Tanacetum cinerariifolium]
MLRIRRRVHGQTFDEPPFEEEILAFIHFLENSAATRTLTDVKQKNTKKSNEMYYPRFTKVIIHHFMSKDSSIPRRNKVNWHYVRDNHMFSTIKLNSNAYKKYYAIATRAAPPNPKASVRRMRSSFDTSITLPTAAASSRLTASAKGKQTAKASKAKNEGTGSIPGVPDAPTDESEVELSWNSTDDESADDEGKDGGDDEEDEGDDGEEGDGDDDNEDDNGDEGDDNDADQEVVRDDDKDDEEEGGDDKHKFDEDESDEETRDEESLILSLKPLKTVKMKGWGLQASLKVEDSHVTLTPVNPDGQQQSSSVSSQFMTSMLNSTLDVGIESIFETTSQLNVPTPTPVAPLPITVPIMTPSTIATITTTSQATILPTTVPSNIIQNLPNFGSLFRFDDRLRDNDEFLKTVDENIKIIKEQVKKQVKVQVSKILPRIEQAVNEQLEAKVLVRSSYSPRTSYAVVVDLSKMELKKILIKKMEGNKSIQRLDEQRNLYKALRHREGKESESASAPTKIATRSAGRSTQGSRYRQASASEFALAEEPMQTTFQIEEPSHLEFDTEDLQLRVESYQKKLNLTKPDSYRSDLKRKKAYTAYSNPRGFIYQNKDKRKRLMRIDELHKFSDGTFTDVRTALDDRLKGIRMQYLPQSIWRKSDKDRAAALIQAIDKRLKTRTIMRSLEWSILTDLQVTQTKHGRMTNLYLSHRFIANCFNAGNIKMEVKSSYLPNFASVLPHIDNAAKGDDPKGWSACCLITRKGKGMSWNDFKFMRIEEFYPSHEMQKLEIELWNHTMVGAGHAAYTDRFHKLARNGSIKKVEKRGNVGEPRKDKSGRDDNKRTRTGSVFATNMNPVGREYEYLAQDCRGVPTNMNHVNARNLLVRACYECGSIDHVRSACPRWNRA